KEFGELNKTLQKADLFLGLARTYQPAEENGEALPPEHKYPQKSTREVVDQARTILADIMNAVATQEYANTAAKADVVVDGAVILPQVPVTVLLYLEKQLNDLQTFVGNMPTLDPAERWNFNDQTGQYATESTRTVRPRK